MAVSNPGRPLLQPVIIIFCIAHESSVIASVTRNYRYLGMKLWAKKRDVWP